MRLRSGGDNLQLCLGARLAVLACVAALAGLARHESSAQASQAGAPAQPTPVRLIQPSRRDLARDTVQPATAEAFFEANLGAEVSGYVSELRVDIGARVKAGQILARIAVPELIQARNAATADVTTQRSAYDRTVELAAHNSITQRAVAEAKGRLDAALARQAEAEAELAYTTIGAPFDGVVTLRTIDLGDIVYQASSPKGKGEPLLRVARVDVIRVKTYVPELDSVWADVGDAATVTFEALPGRVFTSKLARVSGVLDPATRTMLVEIDLPNADGLIRPGLYGRARIALERREHALVLPSAAVRVGEGEAQVFVVTGDAVRRKSVTLGLVDSQWTEITGGLDEAERVVADAATANLADGMQVRVLAQ
jgi:RND family efflux transporter MFP subunit